MPPEAWRRCWRPTSPPANPARSRRQCSPASNTPSTVPKALPRMQRCVNGYGGRTGWRLSTRRSTRSCAHASIPSSKWPGPATQKNPEAMAAFQVRCRDHLQQAIPPANTRPLRVCSQDESRFGLLTVRRRRLPARGVQPIGPVQHGFEWFYVSGAVEPTTCDRFCLELPYLNAEMFYFFIDAFAQSFPDSLNLRLLDKSGAHTAQQLTLPATSCRVFLPPYCPELNPIERVWRDLQDALAWLQFPNLDVPQDYVAMLLRGYEAITLQALAGYPYLVEAIHALRL